MMLHMAKVGYEVMDGHEEVRRGEEVVWRGDVARRGTRQKVSSCVCEYVS
jgi:hypothetical protein